MPLELELNDVTEVLLLDGWHLIVPGTLKLDTLETGVANQYPDLSDSAFQFQDRNNGQTITGPIRSIHAVSTST